MTTELGLKQNKNFSGRKEILFSLKICTIYEFDGKSLKPSFVWNFPTDTDKQGFAQTKFIDIVTPVIATLSVQWILNAFSPYSQWVLFFSALFLISLLQIQWCEINVRVYCNFPKHTLVFISILLFERKIFHGDDCDPTYNDLAGKPLPDSCVSFYWLLTTIAWSVNCFVNVFFVFCCLIVVSIFALGFVCGGYRNCMQSSFDLGNYA